MRILFATLALVMVMGTSAFAASAYDDVPTDHWAYNALDYLTDAGVLEGYPGGFFKGDRTLTRFEFAQAIARLLDTIEQGGGSEDIKVMADSLRAEFSDQLSQLNNTVSDLSNEVNDMTGRVNDLESTVAGHDSRIADMEKKVSSMRSGADWKGSFRYRWQYETRDDAADTDRFRQRISFKLGYTSKINDAVQVGFQLATETGNTNGTSTNFTLGSQQFNTADIFLDRAYFKYSPKWFGYYTEMGCDGKCSPKLDLWAGIIPNPLHDPNEMVFDSDINLQGTAFVYHFNGNFQLTGASAAVVEANGDPIDDDTYFHAIELKHNNFLFCGLDAWVGAYVWQREDRLDTAFGSANDPFMDNGFVHTAPAFSGQAGTHRLTDTFSENFFTVKGGLQYTFRDFLNKPLAVYGEYMVNTESDFNGGANLRFPPGTNVPLIGADDDIGWLVGAQWGAVPSEVGQWYWFARYKEIGSDVIIDGFGDADAGGANVNSLEVSVATMLFKNSMFGITYFLNKMHNAYGYTIPAGREDQQIVQVDWSFKF
jgi:hypothetical protein